MRKSEIAVVGFALFLFFLMGPLMAKRNQQERQEIRQEEVAEEEDIFSERAGETYKVVYRAPGKEEKSVADILWLKKAAEVAMDAGIPHFNVRQKKRRMNVIEGIIELDNDPMRAEYDANEILSLVLPEMTQ